MILGSVVLAGGRSRRMGRPKESLPVGDNSMLGRTVDTLLACTFPVVVVARDREQDLPPLSLECDVVYDQRIDQGPLWGMMAGLQAVRNACDAVFVTGCDAPFVTAAAVDWLSRQLGEHRAVVARIDGILQPLAAVYRVDVLAEVESLVGRGCHKLQALAEACAARVLTEAELDAFDPQRDFLLNVNSPAEYDAVRRRVEGAADDPAAAG